MSYIGYNICFIIVFYAHAYDLKGHKLNTDYVLTFVPYFEFTDLTIEHFNNSVNSWNNAAGKKLMSISGERHYTTGYWKDYDKHYIYKEVRTDIDYVGRTKYFYSAWNSKILKSADILINSRYSFANSQREDRYDTWSVFIHEAGHAAGLAHTNLDDFNVVMNEGIKKNFLRRNLHSDDVSGIKYLYS